MDSFSQVGDMATQAGDMAAEVATNTTEFLMSVSLTEWTHQIWEQAIQFAQRHNLIEIMMEVCNSSGIVQCVLFMSGVAFLAYIMNVVTQKYSFVDRTWSILPVIYTWWIPLASSSPLNLRQGFMMACTLLWGLRLSYNFYRKGGYTLGEQDYRWPIIKEFVYSRLPFPFVFWQIFSLGFIALYQNMLLLMLALPMYVVTLQNEIATTQSNPWNSLDMMASIGMITMLVLEALADEQQWHFQNLKKIFNEDSNDPEVEKAKPSIQQDLKRGFLTHGLFSLSRHPNYFSEMGFWCCYYFFSVSASGIWVNPSILGVALLILLFQGSTILTEEITKNKYGDYAHYQKSTPCFIPSVPCTLKSLQHEKEE